MPQFPNPQLAQQWRDRIERFAQSGLTVADFCDREGYSVASFYQWRRKLRSSVPDRPTGPGDRPASFVAVELQPNAMEASQLNDLKIELPGGAVACLDGNATDEQQRRLIKNIVEALSEVAS
ncbi:IS66 family insertion sequence element accessory protein TnpA [Planctomycetes bacterium TBK1r]|uniref:Transposase n=1 Tax=Stieleria magnilauensis TaxID=2527963 RepID=A0ABX5XJM6_9BACT|nr:hypothetical protein TBK1r_11180 [Planctomycetes bacterium TBK1r]QDV85740.1 hypothetical protein TBK1r_47560 [Planctomycetes bacterium TBK1r]